MKTGTRVEVDKKSAFDWGYEIPAVGTVIGPDPRGINHNIVCVKLDQTSPSIYETNGVHVERIKIIEESNAEHEPRAVASRAQCSCSAGYDPNCQWEGHHAD